MAATVVAWSAGSVKPMPSLSSSTQKSGMWLVWWMSWSRVIVSDHSGRSSTYAPTGSASDSSPSCWSMRIAVAVNCFETDAMSNRVAVVTGVPAARSARPPALARMTVLRHADRGGASGLVGGDQVCDHLARSGATARRAARARLSRRAGSRSPSARRDSARIRRARRTCPAADR